MLLNENWIENQHGFYTDIHIGIHKQIKLDYDLNTSTQNVYYLPILIPYDQDAVSISLTLDYLLLVPTGKSRGQIKRCEFMYLNAGDI